MIKDKYFKKKEIVNGYTIIKKIGEGRYGIAYLAKNEHDEMVVIKQLKVKMLEETRKKLFYEEKILKSLDYEYFPKFISKFKDKFREGYILEFIPGKVFEDIVARERYKFTKEEIYFIAGQILDLIEILQKNKIVHRDIRLPNVIVRENNELALIDFGLARKIDGDMYEKQVDYWYMADFLIHLYYTTYEDNSSEEKPWYEELDINEDERLFLKKLMGIDGRYDNIEEVREQLEKLKAKE